MSLDFISKVIDFTSSTIVKQNIDKLYALLYPLIALDFRHKEDCRIAMGILDAHIHMHTDSTIISSIQLPTLPPVTPSAVQDAIGLSLIGVEVQYGLPAKISAATVIKPFTVT